MPATPPGQPAGAPPVTSFDTAAQQTNNQKAALLAAVAQAGTAGRQALEAQNAALQTQRQQALTGMIGPDQGMNDLMAARQANAGLYSQVNDTYGSQVGAANAEYYDRANAAIPALRERTQQGVNVIKADQDQQARQNALQLELGKLNLQSAQASAARAAGTEPGSVSDREKFDYTKEQDRLQQERDAHNRTVAEEKYAAELAAAEEEKHRQSVHARAQQAASPGTFQEFTKAANLDDASAAQLYVDRLDAGYLKRSGISREALRHWVLDFYGTPASGPSAPSKTPTRGAF